MKINKIVDCTEDIMSILPGKKRGYKKTIIAIAVVVLILIASLVEKYFNETKPIILDTPDTQYAQSEKYDRSFFEGKKYACGTTETFREAQVIRQGQGNVKYTTTKDGCVNKIIGGKAYDPYNDEWVSATSSLELDHVVSLAYAWTHGASKWDKKKAYDFAHNTKCYTDNPMSCAMIVTSKSSNAGKGARGLSEWLPEANQELYIETFNKIIQEWGLE